MPRSMGASLACYLGLAEDRVADGDFEARVASVVDSVLADQAMSDALGRVDISHDVLRRHLLRRTEEYRDLMSPELLTYLERWVPVSVNVNGAVKTLLACVVANVVGVAVVLPQVSPSLGRGFPLAATAAVSTLAALTAVLVRRIRRGDDLGDLLSWDAAARAEAELDEAIRTKGVLPAARAILNVHRTNRSRVATDGVLLNSLGDLRERDYPIETAALHTAEANLQALSRGTLAIVGDRGVGKTTLLTLLCRHRLPEPSRQPKESPVLACVVDAPVRYQGRDFIAHVLTQLCLTVIEDPDERRPRRRPSSGQLAAAMIVCCIGSTLALLQVNAAHAGAAAARAAGEPVRWLFWPGQGLLMAGFLALLAALFLFGPPRRSPARPLLGALVPDRAKHRPIVDRARDCLSAIRFSQELQVIHEGGLARAPFAWKAGRSVRRARHPLTTPEIVELYRGFVQTLTEAGVELRIGIDELDKILKPEEALDFLAEIKPIMNVSGSFCVVSLSDDGHDRLLGYGRDATGAVPVTDSYFDEIVHAEPLTLAEARQLVQRQVFGVPDIYVAVCYALSGGRPRELLRWLRRLLIEVQAGSAADLLHTMRRLLLHDRRLQLLALLRTCAGPDNASALRVTSALIEATHAGATDATDELARVRAMSLTARLLSLPPGDDGRTFLIALRDVFSTTLVDLLCEEDQLKDLAVDADAQRQVFSALAGISTLGAPGALVGLRRLSDLRAARGLPTVPELDVRLSASGIPVGTWPEDAP
jgi:hypothetical protein